jgi:hypothetical protein
MLMGVQCFKVQSSSEELLKIIHRLKRGKLASTPHLSLVSFLNDVA